MLVSSRRPAEVPEWARLQRSLFAQQDKAWRTFADRYTAADGRLVFGDTLGEGSDDRDGVDDFYEAFFNWPMLYLLGGSDDLLAASERHWDGVTAQLTEMGMLVDGYERGYDWFHQGESLLFFYARCLAQPGGTRAAQARRFADLYLPGGPNYDPERRVIRAPHNGAGGPRWGFGDHEVAFPWSLPLRPYGLPLDWLGYDSFDELVADPAKARAYGREMWDRMGRGDTFANVLSTSLAVHAWLLTGEQRYADWVAEYVGAWRDRWAGGPVVPDNAGLSGQVGEYLGGRWYGGHYGWSWPHGLQSMACAAVVAGTNAAFVTGDDAFLDLARNPFDVAMEQAERRRPDDVGSVTSRWTPHLAGLGDRPTLMVPHRRGDAGWFDWNVPPTQYPIWLWHFGRADEDLRRVDALRAGASWDWTAVHDQRTKEENGHEEPWFEYLAGRNPDYPERALRSALATSEQRLDDIARDDTDPVAGPSALDIHLWQHRNPVVTEILLQLTTGTPQVLYNGSPAHLHLRWFHGDGVRPGLPDDVAALVSSIDPDRTVAELVNTGDRPRTLVVQGGSFAEHRIRTVALDDVPAEDVGGPRVTVRLEPRAQARLTLALTLRATTPTLVAGA